MRYSPATLLLALLAIIASSPPALAAVETHRFGEHTRETIDQCRRGRLVGNFDRDLLVVVDLDASGHPFRVRTVDRLTGTVRNTRTGRTVQANGIASDSTLIRRSAISETIELAMRVRIGRTFTDADVGEIEIDPDGEVSFDGTLTFPDLC